MPTIFCRLDAGHPDHPKIRALERALGANALAFHIRLMCFAAIQRPSGLLVELTDKEIAHIARFRGRPGRLVEALLYVPEGERAGLAVREGPWLRLYHYQERQEWLAREEDRSRERLKKRAQRNGICPQDVPTEAGTTGGHERGHFGDIEGDISGTVPPLRGRGRGNIEGTDHLTPPTPLRGKRPEEPAGFAEWWGLYPRKVGKSAAARSYRRATAGKPEMPDKLLAALRRQVDSDHFRGSDGALYVPNPATWLNQGRWDDEPRLSEPRGPANARSAATDASLQRFVERHAAPGEPT